MKFILIGIVGLFFIQGCAAQSQLSKKMPEDVSISLNQTGGMSRSYKKIKISGGVLKVEELNGNRDKPQRWSAKISPADLAKLYQVFAENEFDTIKNDERKGIVYDAGSENISLSLDKTKYFQVTYGKNSPLSGINLQRYKAVRNAINELLAQHENRQTNQEMSATEKYIQGTWRVEGGNNKRNWFLEWTFENGIFTQSGYPPLFQKGSYRIVNVTDGKITVDLFDQNGNFGDEKRTIVIVTDPESEKLTISGTNGFSRLEAKITVEN